MVPALQFEKASIEFGPDFGMSQRVVDGHQETLDGGIESAKMILKAGGRLGMGGDYGFAWNPHGTYAKELSFFIRGSVEEQQQAAPSSKRDERVFIHPSSFNFSVGNYYTPWLVYHNLVRTSKPFLH